MAKKRYLKGVVTNCEKLNIRSEPSLEGGRKTVVEVIDALTNVMVMPLSDTEEWYKVRIGSTNKGYCMSKYIAIEVEEGDKK